MLGEVESDTIRICGDVTTQPLGLDCQIRAAE